MAFCKNRALKLNMCKSLWVLVLLAFAFSANAQDFSDLYADTSASVVTIHTATVGSDGEQVTPLGLGSGVLIEETLVITAAHVIQSADRIVVKFKDGYTTPAEVVTSVISSDVAVLQLENPPENASVATIGDSDDVRIGEPVYVIGAPFGIEQTLSVGTLSGRLSRGLIAGGEPIEFLQTDTSINTGNSGGPMFSKEGDVIGIVSFILTKSGGFDGIGFAVSINGVEEALLNGSAFWTGFEGIFLEPNIAAALNVPQPTGMLVQHVVSGSIADAAGMKGGTITTRINGVDFKLGGDIVLSIQGIVCDGPHNFKAIKEQIASLTPGDSFAVKVLRGGEVLDLLAVATE